MRDEPEPSLAAELRVEELERAGGGVAGVGEGDLLGGSAKLVEPDQLGVGHVDLAADLEQAGGAALEDQGDLADGLEIGRDVVAALAVASGRPRDEVAVLVSERDGDAVDLELDDVANRLAGVQPPADPNVPVAELVVGIGVVDREHRDDVADGREAFQRLATDSLGGTVGRDRTRDGGLELGRGAPSCRSNSRSLISGAAST